MKKIIVSIVILMFIMVFNNSNVNAWYTCNSWYSLITPIQWNVYCSDNVCIRDYYAFFNYQGSTGWGQIAYEQWYRSQICMKQNSNVWYRSSYHHILWSWWNRTDTWYFPSNDVWPFYTFIYSAPVLNNTPSVTSISSTSTSITLSNENTVAFSVSWITDTDSWQTKYFDFSIDWWSYTYVWSSSSVLNTFTYNFSRDLSSLSEWNHTFSFRIYDWSDYSNIVSTTLEKDTINPILSEITGIAVNGNDSTPSYTFNSTEVWNIIYWGSCSSTSTTSFIWNNTITLNSLWNWTYSNCTIIVTDSAWNISNTLNIPTFIIDTTAPTISEVTAIPFNVNTSTPTYVLNSDEDWSITYGWDCSSSATLVTTWNNSITLNSLVDWTYSNCTIQVTDISWNISNTLNIPTFIIDDIAPILSEITIIPTNTNNTTPDYTFNSTEAWTITYWGSCSSSITSAVIWNNTITLDTLWEGTYSNCTIQVTDVSWNISDVLIISEFIVDTIAPVNPTDILYNWGIWYSTTKSINIEITHPNEGDIAQWCVIDSTLLIDSCVWTNTKPISYTFFAEWYNKIDLYLKDLAWNVNKVVWNEEILIDTIDVIITLITDVNSSYTNTTKIVKAIAMDDNLVDFSYAIVDNSIVCDWGILYPINYSSGTDIILDNESYNGKKICFLAYDKAWRTSYAWSSLIENIDLTNPVEANYSWVYQSAWNKIKFKWTCTPETGLEFVVKDNWVEIARESLWNPCIIDFEYILSDSISTHNIEYYLEDNATNKSSIQTMTWYVDSSWILITPGNWKIVEPIITFFGYALPNTEVKIKETSWNTYIATGFTDNNWIFSIQTINSQALWNLTIDLEVWIVAKNQPRTIIISDTSLIIPTIIEESVYSVYSWIKDILSFETQLISFTAKWEALSTFNVYSYSEVSWNKVITEIYQWKFDSNWEAFVSSNVALPGGENELMIIDTIHNVSSNIIYMVVADPFWTVYDSISKKTLEWAKITFCEEGETTPAILPLLHWEAQPNPVTTDKNWNYFSYETVGNNYYICDVELADYTFASTIIASWTDNLDNTPNIWSHGQIFEILPTPLHIDIPLDRIIPEVKSSWGWSYSSYSILVADSIQKKYSTNWNRQLMVFTEQWTKTLTKIQSKLFNGWVYSWDIYRVLYEGTKTSKLKKWIEFNKEIVIQITDLDLNNFKVYIKYDQLDKYELFTDYSLNWTTITFKTIKWFELFIDKNIEVENYKTNEELEKEVVTLNKRYDVKFYEIENIREYLIFIRKLDSKYWERISIIPNEKVLSLFPTIFAKIEGINQDKITNKYKYIYNYLGNIYNSRYDTLVVK